jgi:hypothetical protein
MTVYHGHVDGFFGSFLSLGELRNWAITCRDQRGCKGKTLKIMQGKRHGSVDVFPPHRPSKEIVL